MKLKQLQTKASKVFLANLKRDSIKANDDYLVLKITEELGEFLQSYLVYKRRCRPEKYLSPRKTKRALSKELADVLGIIFVIAKTLKIDVEEALIKKWITREWIKK
jgi:NTP pyrophosphatase (non-canonical NTP hydrolase)